MEAARAFHGVENDGLLLGNNVWWYYPDGTHDIPYAVMDGEATTTGTVKIHVQTIADEEVQEVPSAVADVKQEAPTPVFLVLVAIAVAVWRRR